ncbi:MAG TPA: RNA polymerase sigma factor RpoD/SigA [bacterium]|nr:RNA polymerase sigma factor RpoD/SigA [bacterium]
MKLADTELSIAPSLLQTDDTPLSVEEERCLIQRFRDGDEEARRRLIESNLRFVIKMAAQYRGYGVSLEDLVQEGNLGLIEALEKFDPTKGCRLITYASWWIRLYVQRMIEQRSRTVNLPINKVEVLRKIRSYETLFELEHGRKPMIEEIADHLCVPQKRVHDVLRLAPTFCSLHSQDEEKGGLDRVLSDEESASAEEWVCLDEMQSRLRRAMQVLNRREKAVLAWRFGLLQDGERFSLRQVGQKLNLSAEGVRQIEEQALEKLRRPRVRMHIEGLLA